MATESGTSTEPVEEDPLAGRDWDPAPLPEAAKFVVLEKIHRAEGVALGTTYQYSYKSLPKIQVLPRAFAALKRDHPKENPVNWKALRTQ